jgi:hypothetical protein
LLDVREILGNLVEDLVPQHHAVALRVRLGDQRQVLALALARQLERKAVDALHACPGEYRGLGGYLFGQPLVHAPARSGILALRVLADDHPVDLLGIF